MFPKSRFLSRQTLNKLVQFLKVLGIGPISWLLKAVKFWRDPLWHKFWGKELVKWFVFSCSTTNFKFPISWGTRLESWLLWRNNTSNLLKLSTDIGTVPFNWLVSLFSAIQNLRIQPKANMRNTIHLKLGEFRKPLTFILIMFPQRQTTRFSFVSPSLSLSLSLSLYIYIYIK